VFILHYAWVQVVCTWRELMFTVAPGQYNVLHTIFLSAVFFSVRHIGCQSQICIHFSIGWYKCCEVLPVWLLCPYVARDPFWERHVCKLCCDCSMPCITTAVYVCRRKCWWLRGTASFATNAFAPVTLWGMLDTKFTKVGHFSGW